MCSQSWVSCQELQPYWGFRFQIWRTVKVTIVMSSAVWYLLHVYHVQMNHIYFSTTLDTDYYRLQEGALSYRLCTWAVWLWVITLTGSFQWFDYWPHLFCYQVYGSNLFDVSCNPTTIFAVQRVHLTSCLTAWYKAHTYSILPTVQKFPSSTLGTAEWLVNHATHFAYFAVQYTVRTVRCTRVYTCTAWFNWLVVTRALHHTSRPTACATINRETVNMRHKH